MDGQGYDVVIHVQKLLENEQFSEIVDLLESQSNLELIDENAWDIIPIVTSNLKPCNDDQKSTYYNIYENILLLLSRRGNPKELLLGLVEEADYFKREELFHIFLNPLKEVLLRVPGKRGRSFEEVLDILEVHIRTLPVPVDYDLEGDERFLLDMDPAVQITGIVLPKYISFFQPFVDEVSIDKVKGKNVCYFDRVERQRQLLEIFLLKLFEYPLLYHDIHHDISRAKSTIRLCCENIVLYISYICSNIFTLYSLSQVEYSVMPTEDDCSSKNFLKSMELTNEDPMDYSVSQLAIATFAFAVFAEQLAPDSRPYVYSNIYLFQKHLHFLIKLLSRVENLVIYKGLRLSEFFLRNVMECEFPSEYLELKKFEVFPKILANIAIHCPVEEHRHLSIKLFQEYIAKYDWEGRYRLSLLIISSVNHSGVQGLIINLYKNFIHSCLNRKDSSVSCFYGKNLLLFLRYALKLPEDVETDLLEYSDKILSALNLLRYLVLRDSITENVTGIWDIVSKVKETFLKPLQTGLVLSKAHYKLRMQLLKDEKAVKHDFINSTVTVNNQVLPNLSSNQHLHIVETAILTFDMIESVLVRLKEIL